jgi:outer membrane protein assembly factor BamD (BamD/ComL family)
MIEELNNKLAEKDYQNAQLYYRMEYYKAAIAYFDYVLEHHHDSKYAPDAMLGKARSLYARKDYAGATHALESFSTRFPDSALKKDVAELRTEIQTASSGH